ncbi:MAG: hypothetical protein LUF89_00630 [Ruminococcus sp.]|nr:hypothetical protein [Ruminococcus sp.]
MDRVKKYDEEFKKQAIKLAKEIGNKAAVSELGIPMLWQKTYVHGFAE